MDVPLPIDPRLSIVIASVAAPPSLINCVRSFLDQPAREAVEVIVATSASDAAIAALVHACPAVRIIRVAQPTSIPHLRACGFESARGTIIAMTEDHCLASPDWIERALRAHASGGDAIGGAVENGATERFVDWAVFFCEYGRHMLPIAAGPTTDLPGPNVTYARRAVACFKDLLAVNTWEQVWHWRLQAHGMTLLADPALIVYHRKSFTFRGFLAERYHYSRSFAGHRVAGASLPRRAFFLFTTPLLPPLVLYRVLKRVWPKGRFRRTLMLTLPMLAAFSVSWAIGEFVGYAAGEGDSASRIE
jgi:hypothetical protein